MKKLFDVAFSTGDNHVSEKFLTELQSDDNWQQVSQVDELLFTKEAWHKESFNAFLGLDDRGRVFFQFYGKSESFLGLADATFLVEAPNLPCVFPEEEACQCLLGYMQQLNILLVDFEIEQVTERRFRG